MAPEVLAEELLNIMASENTRGPEFGILTTDHRDNWAEAREELLKPAGNRENLAIIERSLFTVSLDEDVAAKNDEKLDVNGLQLIHGGGSMLNSANRWMDKTIQVSPSDNLS